MRVTGMLGATHGADGKPTKCRRFTRRLAERGHSVWRRMGSVSLSGNRIVTPTKMLRWSRMCLGQVMGSVVKFKFRQFSGRKSFFQVEKCGPALACTSGPFA